MNNLLDLLHTSLANLLDLKDSRVFTALKARYDKEFPYPKAPSFAQPFALGRLEIDELLELAIKYRSEKLLTALAGMGTVDYDGDGTMQDTVDVWIGRRDPYIEQAIINKALARKDQKKSKTTTLLRKVYGLSANPPTLNHLAFIKYLICSGDLVSVVLNTQSPLKDPETYVPSGLRLQMLTSMMDDSIAAKCCFSRLEIDRPQPSRMVVTMSILILLSAPNEQLELALGIDKLDEFKKWYKWQELAKLCQIKFYPREGGNFNSAALVSLQENGVSDIHIVFNTEEKRQAFLHRHPEYPPDRTSVEVIPDLSEGSATMIRQWYKDGCPDSDNNLAKKLQELNIHPAVHQIIIDHHLFTPWV